ncbi:MAG: membrane protein insertase YidC, partial [Betaproteobacteria bacterium]
MDTQRLILLFIFGFSVLMLWEAWQREHRPAPPATVQQPSLPASPAAPKAAAPSAPAIPGAIGAPAITPPAGGETIRVTTDLVVADIDTLGGTLKRLELLRHKDSADPDK